eukprot:4110264-Amphidinium_carterae.1
MDNSAPTDMPPGAGFPQIEKRSQSEDNTPPDTGEQKKGKPEVGEAKVTTPQGSFDALRSDIRQCYYSLDITSPNSPEGTVVSCTPNLVSGRIGTQDRVTGVNTNSWQAPVNELAWAPDARLFVYEQRLLQVVGERLTIKYKIEEFLDA